MSPLLHVTFDAQGEPGPARVARTVGQVPEPPRVASARAGDEAWVAYTAVGAAATAAVGLVPLGRAEASPVPLVKGTGYGALAVGAAVTRAGAVFVTEAPLPKEGEAAEAKRQLEVRFVDAGGHLGVPWVLDDTTSTRGEPAVAALPGGTVAVAERSAGGVRVHLGRCGRGGAPPRSVRERARE
jgi:hypothetical protein